MVTSLYRKCILLYFFKLQQQFKFNYFQQILHESFPNLRIYYGVQRRYPNFIINKYYGATKKNMCVLYLLNEAINVFYS